MKMYGIQFNDIPARFGSFPFYYTKAEAEAVAARWRADWPHNTYRVVRVDLRINAGARP
jgi:hypothetical protein